MFPFTFVQYIYRVILFNIKFCTLDCIYGYVDTKNNIHKLEILMGDCNEEETEENEETTDQ